MTKTKIFRNTKVDKKHLKELMSWVFNNFGIIKSSYLANQLKLIGFHYATQAGISISIEDLRVPPIKNKLLISATKEVYKAESDLKSGNLTEVERFQKVINTWNMTSETLKEEVVNYFANRDPLNSIYIMAFSGARGNLSQVRQLVGMRGLMADANGQIIALPIVENFREGLTITDYIISSYGARKGLVDTALRTADSGYLTRRLIDVAQDLITREKNCGTNQGIRLASIKNGNKILLGLKERGLGRILSTDIYSKKLYNTTDSKEILQVRTEITPTIAKDFEKFNIQEINVRSPLTCNSSRSVCQACYGWNLAYGRLIDLGEAIGIIAAQSIGEPGTQLTMRTFHTGGVFTTEPNRQIKAVNSGFINFSQFLKVKKIRTKYGQEALITENDGQLNLTTISNKIIEIPVASKTLLFVKNNSFIKKKDLILELPSQTKKTGEEQVFKDLSSKISGEIIIEKDNKKNLSLIPNINTKIKRLWVLEGQVYIIPNKSKIRVKTNQIIPKNRVIADVNLTTITGGSINLKQSDSLSTSYKLSHYARDIISSDIYVEMFNDQAECCCIYGANGKKIILHHDPENELLSSTNSVLGYLKNQNFYTKCGGHFYINRKDQKLNPKIRTVYKNTLKTNETFNTIFYIPESYYEINTALTELSIKQGAEIDPQTEIANDIRIDFTGVVDFRISKNPLKTLILKPARVIETKHEKAAKLLHNQIFFPGELLLNEIQIDSLTYVEFKKIDGVCFLWLLPVVRYEFLNLKNKMKEIFHDNNITNNIDTEPIHYLFDDINSIKLDQPINLLNQIVSYKLIKCNDELTGYTRFDNNGGPKSSIRLNLQLFESSKINKYIPNEIEKSNIQTQTIVKNNQFLEPWSVIATYSIISTQKTQIQLIKQQLNKNTKNRYLLISDSNNHKRIYPKLGNLKFKHNTFVKTGDLLNRCYRFQYSGLIEKTDNNNYAIHLAQPYLFSNIFEINYNSGDLISNGAILGKLAYEQDRTGDIVQGLPRVEEILEARKPKLEAVIARQPSFISQILYNDNSDSKITLVMLPSSDLDQNHNRYQVLPFKRLLVSEGEFINIAQPLTDDPINPHTFLETYFKYFQNLNIYTTYQCVYRSFRCIQALLVNSVQSVYFSQGVTIADKHIEIIVKQMTSKVTITDSGDSAILIEELISLEQINYINECLSQKTKIEAHYQPILLGITKASLKTDSFISAASFQYTTRVLTEAAIQGKIDWLRGLKENVIIGRLIPTGTGFNTFSDISYLSVRLPSNQNVTTAKKLPSQKEARLKYKRLSKKYLRK